MKLNELKEFVPRYTNGKEITYKQMVYSAKRKIEILFEGTYCNYQFYILNLGTHPTAYIEIPRESKFFGKGYNEIYNMGIDIDVHGGLTYASSYLQDIKKNTWFIGWDYAHAFDYYGGYEIGEFNLNENTKKWTTEEIFEDVVKAIEQLIEEENNE